jgi:uncharacterized protein YndB with AHSA1/START domain
MSLATSDPIVQKSVTVQATAARAFSVFTAGIDAWWPKSHHIGKGPLAETVIESRVGGICYGRSEDGSVCPWGKVLVWDPPHRLVLAWQVAPDWTYEPDLAKASEVEVRFTAVDPQHTRVELEHRHFSRHGVGGDTLRTAVDSANGWTGLLQLFSATAGGGIAASASLASPAAPLSFVFAANSALIVRAFDGLGDDRLWHRPTPHNNPPLWIAGHIVHVRGSMLRLLGGDPLDTGWGDLFAGGAALDDPAKYPGKADVLRVHEEVAKRIVARLGALTAADLAREATIGPKPPGVKTVGDQLGFFALHDSYHVGQLGFIRKALGLSALVG